MHIPSSIGNTLAANTLGLVLCVTPSTVAGSGATVATEQGNKSTTVATGSKVNQVITDIAFSNASGVGYIELCAFKAERLFAAPAVGTNPIPTTTEALTQGLQQIARLNMPGWIFKYLQRPLSAETPTHFKLPVSLGKFKKSKWRIGDYYGIMIFNRSTASITYDMQCRFKEIK